MSGSRRKERFVGSWLRRAFQFGSAGGLVVLFVLVVLTAPSAQAATAVWGGGTGTFGTSANWVTGSAPGSSDTVLFSGWAPLSRSGWTCSASLGTGASSAKDGDLSTLWAANTNQVSGQSFTVDLGSTQTFRGITMDATDVATDYPRAFSVYVSTDGVSWGSAVTTGTGSSAVVTVALPTAQTKRYIKIQLTGSAANWWRIGELYVYGTTAETELSTNGWTASASASGGGPASNAIDSDLTSKWSPGVVQASGQWFSVDMGSAQTFTRIDMEAYPQITDYPRGYNVYVSSDGVSWGSSIASQTPSTPSTSITFASQTKRYIKVQLNTGNGSFWWALFDFKVYGTPANCTISSNASVGSIELDKSITVTKSSGVTLTTSGSYSQSAGTFTGGTKAITVGTSFNLSGGTFTSTSGTLDVGTTFNYTGGTFTHNSGTVLLSSTSNQSFSSGGATFYNLAINDSLLAYWPLDEGSGTSVADGSGYGTTATVSGAGATWQSSVPSAISFRDPYSLALNGSTGSVALGTGSLPATNAAQTISLWAKITSSAGNQNIISLSNGSSAGLQLKVIGGNLGAYAWGGGTYVTTTAPSTGVWHHIAYTYNGSGAQTLYIDGAATTASVSNQSTTVTTAYLGTYSPNSEMFAGSLDDVRIYGRVLNDTEIYSLYIGNDPGTAAATQSVTGTVTVNGDLTIAGGLSLGTGTLNVAGDWLNYGGRFSATYWGGATVNLTGTTTTNYIRSGGQFLPTINITGSGKWTLADDLNVDGNNDIALTTGSMDISTYTLRTPGLTAGSGTLTASSGTVVLHGSWVHGISVGSYNILRLEDPTESGLIGYWKLDDGQGPYAIDWGGSGYSGTLINEPLWSVSVPPAVEFYDPHALTFDGAATYVDVSTAVTPTNAAMTACAWVKFNNVTGTQTIASTDGTNISGFFLKKNSSHKFGMQFYASDSTGAANYDASGTTTATTNTWYHVCGVRTAGVARIYVNGVQEGSDTTITSSFAASGHTILGAGKSTSRTQFFNGTMDDVRIYNVALTTAQVKALAAGRYAGTGGGTTYTLNTNLTVGSTFSIDSGGLSTSSYTLGTATSDATKVAYVSGGTLTVGSSTATFNGGLTVRDEGTLALNTASGAVSIGTSSASKTLTIDGTLSASTTSATIKATSSSFPLAFTVGGSASATPIINVSGLSVQNTDANGMNINADTSSVTTFTQFDNVYWSLGSATVGAPFLQIYSTSLGLVTSGHKFTFASAHPDYAVKLTGNGTGDGETRAIFGAALCPTSLCTSSNKSDDDSDNNGVGDIVPSTGNEAVVQFVRAAPSDTAGTIEGFPTAAFNWNTFTYYSTYVAYRSFSGSQDRLFVRASSGAPAGVSYYWDLPTAAGHFVGTPRWTQLSSVNYVYVGTTAGYVYKLVDNGSSLALAGSPWDTAYCHGGSPCDVDDSITSPLAIDDTNVYWVGTDTAGARKFFVLTHGKSLTSAALSIPAAVTASPALATVSSFSYLFTGMQGFLYKIKVTDQSATSWTQPATTSTINGRVTVNNSLVYLPDNRGHMYAVTASGLATDWVHQDTANGHGGSCSDGGACTIKNLYVDSSDRVMFGDQDGHIYVVTKNGGGSTIMTGYPIATGEAITTAPLYQAGIMVVGTTSGTLLVINRRTVSGGTPSTVATYKLGSAVSTISYNANTNSNNGAYMVGTSAGKLFYIDKATDGDAFQ